MTYNEIWVIVVPYVRIEEPTDVDTAKHDWLCENQNEK